MAELFFNNATAELAENINDSVDNFDVTNSTFGSVFENTTRIKIDDEIMILYDNTSDVFTVGRGEEGTTAASHTMGAIISGVLTSGSLDTFRLANIGLPTTHYVSSGVITLTSNFVVLDGEELFDDVDYITGGKPGDIIVVRMGTGNPVILKHATGNLVLSSAADIYLNDVLVQVTLVYDGTSWQQIAYSFNGNPA